MSIINRFKTKLLTDQIPWIIYIGIMVWIQIVITGSLADAVIQYSEVYGEAGSIYVNTVIPFILISGILLNTVSFIMRRVWIAFFSVFIVMLVGIIIFYGLTYPLLTSEIPYNFFSNIVSNIMLDLFIALIPTILFTYFLNLVNIDRRYTSVETEKIIYIPFDLVFGVSLTIGLALFILYLNQLFSASIKSSLDAVPREIAPLIRDLLNTNIGQLLIILVFLSLTTYIIYGLVEPLSIYIGGLAGQARDIIEEEYSRMARKDIGLLKPNLVYVLVNGLPYLILTFIVFTYNILFIEGLMELYRVANIPELIIRLFTTYYEDLYLYSNNAPVTPGDINLLNAIDWYELEVYIETLRAIIRFIFRLIF